MDLPRWAAMSRYWKSHPPVHLMVQGYLGIEPDGHAGGAKQQQTEQDDLASFMSAFSAGGGMIN